MQPGVWMGSKLRMAVLAGLLLVPAAARAEMPDYDVDKHCNQVYEMAGKSQAIKQACYQQEQQAYDKLKPKWDALPASMRSHCDQVGRMAGQSFTLLEACVEQEQQAKDQNKQFKFQR